MKKLTDKLDKAAVACREAADALEEVPQFRRVAPLFNTHFVRTDSLREEADHLDRWMLTLREEEQPT